MFRKRSLLVLGALATSVALVAPSVFADDPPDSHRPNDNTMQDRDPYDPLRDQGQRGSPPDMRPDAPFGELEIERQRTGGAESLSQALGLGPSYTTQFHWFLGRTLPLSPVLYPIENDTSVVEWIGECTSRDGWKDTTCYGGGWGVEEPKPGPAISSRMPSSS